MTERFTKQELPISVVIATLGGNVLRTAIAYLNKGNAVPAEIIVCIPETEVSNANSVSGWGNVRIVKTSCRGQVSQRAVGLKMAKHDYVMQFDDDVILPPTALETLFDTLTAKGLGHIIAPFFRIQSNGDDGTRYDKGFGGFVRSCYYTLVCGAAFGKNRFGCIASSGIGFGVPMSTEAERVVESEWLPGGVALCHKEDLIIENYYPFLGKAFSEDLIHSILWRRQGCRLWTALDVSAMIEVSVESFAWRSVIGRYRAHAYVAKLMGGHVWRTRLWFMFYCLLNVRELTLQNIFNRYHNIASGQNNQINSVSKK
jgi:glycosyltransferase involved in cell wall biosynthesis